MIRRGPLVVLAAVAVVVAGVVVLLAHRRPASPVQSSARSESESSLLVVTWAPSLCTFETSAGGCRSGRVARHGQNFLLHGLWPQPRERQYCGVPERARDRRPIDLPPELRARLDAMMSDPKELAPHEWYAHGTCSGVTPAEYFGIATTLADQAIAVLDPVFDGAVGRTLSSRTVRDAVDAKVGKGTGSRVSLACRGNPGQGSVVFEVHLSLPPVQQLREVSSLADALAAAPTVRPGCGQGMVP